MVTVKWRRMNQPNNPNKNKFLSFMGFGFQMIATIAVFGWIGNYLDTYLKNSKPFLTLVFLLLGTMGSLWQLIKQVTKK